MSLSVASNIQSLKIQTAIGRTSNDLSKAYERLASGLRINKASDDPAGLALADKLHADTSSLTVAIRNGNDGLSLAATADAGLEEINQLLTRMSELANQSSNSIYTNAQRSAMASEFSALGSEIERLSVTTTFNALPLLSNSSNVSIQIGIDSSSNSRISFAGVLGTLNSLGLGTTGGALNYSILGTTVDASVTASRLALTALSTAIDTVGSQRGQVGAFQSRLQYAIEAVTQDRDVKLAAESRIRDADVATEVANLVRLQVLQQAQSAILAAANQQPAVVLKLLA